MGLKNLKFWFSWPVQKLMGFHKAIWEGDKNHMCVCILLVWFSNIPWLMGVLESSGEIVMITEMVFTSPSPDLRCEGERRQMPTQNTNGVTTKNVAFDTVNHLLISKPKLWIDDVFYRNDSKNSIGHRFMFAKIENRCFHLHLKLIFKIKSLGSYDQRNIRFHLLLRYIFKVQCICHL